MNKKNKFIKILPFIIVLLVVIALIVRANKGFPQKQKIEETSLNEYLDLNDISIMVTDKKIAKKDSDGFPIVAINFCIKNNTSKDMDLSNVSELITLYQGFDNGMIQNLDYGIDDESNNFPIYDDKDLIIGPNEAKEYVFYFYLSKDESTDKNFIYIDKTLYEDDFNNCLENGTILYKTIALGAFDE
ncbi:DUF5067 domain-containing protein [Anaerococcus provencensis]|uniref:DUF5067 domain-containing protein n=1 Tax=Anaerococcus provencensis TaxID=938293 RepID=UPI0003015C63|nr:DUF5067 domain-containing protein [Anaerococcus provencensis]